MRHLWSGYLQSFTDLSYMQCSCFFEQFHDLEMWRCNILLKACYYRFYELPAGIKFPWFVFFQKDSGMRPKEPPISMRAAMVLMSFLCIYLGLVPGPLYALLPYPVDYVPYTGSHVVFQLQLLLFSGLAFFLLLGFLKRTLTITLDFDWFWRGGGRALAREFNWRGGQAWGALAARYFRACRGFAEALSGRNRPQDLAS